MRRLVRLFLVFAKMGCFTFGGGYAILPVLERELIEKRGWTTLDDVMRYYTIAQITPGIIAVNVSTFIGYKYAGIAGGIVATLGFVFPSTVMIMVIAVVLRNFADIPVVQHGFHGIRLAVGALILSTISKLIKRLPRKGAGAKWNIAMLCIFAASFLASVIININPVFVILAAGAIGVLLFGNIKNITGKGAL